jgi:hypothetical protein
MRNAQIRRELAEAYELIARLGAATIMTLAPGAAVAAVLLWLGAPIWLIMVAFFLTAILAVPMPIVWFGMWRDSLNQKSEYEVRAQGRIEQDADGLQLREARWNREAQQDKDRAYERDRKEDEERESP